MKKHINLCFLLSIINSVRLALDLDGNLASVIFLMKNKIMAQVRENIAYRQWRGHYEWDTCQQEMFDPSVVVVPPAGRPTAVPLWVPALRAGCLRGGGMVSGRYDAEEWLTPACHLTWFCSVRDSGMFTRVHTHVRHMISTSDNKCNKRTLFLLSFDAKHAGKLALTHSHLFTFR